MSTASSKSKERGPKRFFWEGTLNNYTEEDCETVREVFEHIGKEFSVGKEIGKEKKTPHLQMFISLHKGNHKSFLLNKFKKTCVGERISWREVRNVDAIRSYVVKDGDILCEKKLTGKKKTLLELILEGKQPDAWQDMEKREDWMKCPKCKVSLTEIRCNCDQKI
jgi:hypothetical protein